jgi:hypothetical protein
MCGGSLGTFCVDYKIFLIFIINNLQNNEKKSFYILEFVPCSHVGHIFRPGHPYNMTGEKGKGDVHGRNSMRL